MKLLINETQYQSIIKRIKDYEDKISFMKQNLIVSVERDIFDFLYSNYPGEKRQYGANSTFHITSEYLSEKLGHNIRLVVWVWVKTDYVEVALSYSSTKDTMNRIKWYFESEMTEDEFYSKLDKLIQRKLSQKYMDNLLKKIN